MRSKWRSTRRIAYLLLIVALLGMMVIYYVASAPPTPPGTSHDSPLDFQDYLAIQVQQSDGLHALNPSHPIGESGGTWMTHQYDSYGIDSQHYPLYMDTPSQVCQSSCTFHVKTKVAHPYTLGDFFAVWGYPIGPSNTLGYASSNSMAWQMCTGVNGGSQTINNQWGQLALQPNLLIHLVYYNTTSGTGCA